MIVTQIYVMHITCTHNTIYIRAFIRLSAAAHLRHLDSLHLYPENCAAIGHACVPLAGGGVVDRGQGVAGFSESGAENALGQKLLVSGLSKSSGTCTSWTQ